MGWRRALLLAVLLLASVAAALIAWFMLNPASSPTQTMVVLTTAGRIQGKWSTSSKGRTFAAFEGIPYAQPPVGELRFQSPVPAAAWSHVRDTVRPGSPCMQTEGFTGHPEVAGSEDCLFVNVYTLERQMLSHPKKLPVMVFIHGGAFVSGSGDIYGPEYLMDRDVVFVNFNYRMGPLGFLSTADNVITGNFGLKDQVLALQWVRDNIRAFGGDPDLVTIFGQSAGSASVNFHMLSPLSKGLFHRAIAMSGSSLTPWAFDTPAKAKQQAARMATLVGCPTEPSSALRDCLLTKPAESIISAAELFAVWGSHPMIPFKPTAEAAGPWAFLDRHAIQAYANGQASDVPFMHGFVTHEGCILSVPIMQNPQFIKDLDSRFAELAALMFFTDHLPESANQAAYGQLRNMYFGDEPITFQARPKLVDLITDVFFSVSTLETIKLQKKWSQSPVYMYVSEHYGNRSYTQLFGDKATTCGMCHADDLLYLFPLKASFPAEPSIADQAFSEKLLDLFTTFALEGTPTIDGSWKEVQRPEQAEYAHLTGEGDLTMRSNFAPDRIHHWFQLPFNMAINSPNLVMGEL